MKNKIMLLASVILTLISLTLVATGCKNTANGAGKDIENMGEKIQEKTQ
jgi:predicted small secreted protein